MRALDAPLVARRKKKSAPTSTGPPTTSMMKNTNSSVSTTRSPMGNTPVASSAHTIVILTLAEDVFEPSLTM